MLIYMKFRFWWKRNLIFPFSSFEINSIEKKLLKDNTKYYLIKLLYLGKYVHNLKKNIMLILKIKIIMI